MCCAWVVAFPVIAWASTSGGFDGIVIRVISGALVGERVINVILAIVVQVNPKQ